MKKVSGRVVCGIFIAVVCVVGCGQTGPLYLPASVGSPKKPADTPQGASSRASSIQASSIQASSIQASSAQANSTQAKSAQVASSQASSN